MNHLLRLVRPLVVALAALWPACSLAAGGENPFARSALDVTVAVSDMDAAVEFYTDALKFTEVEGYSMPGALAQAIGLNGGDAVDVRVLVAVAETTATRLKLVPLPDEPATGVPEDGPLRSTGYRYVTVFVEDLAEMLKRLRGSGIEAHVEQPVKLREGTVDVNVALVADPDGNWIELVGPAAGDDA